MGQSLWHTSIPLAEFVVRAVLVYLFVVVLLRLSGKRTLGQMSATELVAILLISNAVQNSMNGGDNSVAGGFVLAMTLVALSRGIAWVNFRSKKARAIFEGVPRLLIHRGQPVASGLRRELISEAELKTLLRRQGFHHFADVKLAVLEANGSLTVERVAEPAPAAPDGAAAASGPAVV